MRKPNVDNLIFANIHPKPELHEIEVARILAGSYKTTISFLAPRNGYKMRTPDIEMMGNLWEIKSPTGNSKRYTIQDQFKGLKQSRNLIIDARRADLDDTIMYAQVLRESKKRSHVGKLIYITKKGHVKRIA